MLPLRILPYRNGSRSAAALARALYTKQINLRSSVISVLSAKTIINWGNSGRNLPPDGLGDQHILINSLESVRVAGNKADAFSVMFSRGVSVPTYTTDMQVAQSWYDEGKVVVERHILTGNSGRGLRIADPDNDDSIESAPLYTQYINKQDEYRVHVASGTVIDVQRKARRLETPDSQVNWRVRNLEGGFVFVRGNTNPPACVLEESKNAVKALGLDFGAVDVIYNAHRGQAYVLEVNTAPGLEGATLDIYANMVRNYLHRNSMSRIEWQPTLTEAVEEQQVEQPVNIEAQELEESVELSPDPVVQSNPSSSLFAIAVNRVANVDNGLFRTREEAEEVYNTSLVFQNLVDLNVEIVEVRL